MELKTRGDEYGFLERGLSFRETAFHRHGRGDPRRFPRLRLSLCFCRREGNLGSLRALARGKGFKIFSKTFPVSLRLGLITLIFIVKENHKKSTVG